MYNNAKTEPSHSLLLNLCCSCLHELKWYYEYCICTTYWGKSGDLNHIYQMFGCTLISVLVCLSSMCVGNCNGDMVGLGLIVLKVGYIMSIPISAGVGLERETDGMDRWEGVREKESEWDERRGKARLKGLTTMDGYGIYKKKAKMLEGSLQKT